MTSKNLFFKLQIEDLKRRLGSIILMFLAFFISLPIFCTLTMESSLIRSSHERSIIFYNNAHNVSFGNIGIVLTSIIGAIILGLGGFSYLHSRKKVDFYHSGPIRKELHFFVRYLNGILIFLVPYIINLIITFIIYAVKGYIDSTIIMSAITALSIHLLHFLIFYSVAILAVVLTGQIIISVVVATILYTFAPLLRVIIQDFMNQFFTTYFINVLNDMIIFSSTKWVSALSLFIVNLQLYEREYPINYDKYVYENLPLCTVFGILLSVIIISTIALYLYKKRSLEKAGQAMVFRLAESIFKFLVVVIAGFLGGFLFHSFHESITWYLFGILLFFTLAACIIEMIYHYDVRKAFAHKIEFFCFLAFTTIATLSFYKDWYEYDTYLPKQEEIQSVSISFDTQPYVEQYFYDFEGDYWYGDKTGFQLKYTKITNTDLVYPLLQNAIMDTKMQKGKIKRAEYNNYYNITEQPIYEILVSVKYVLKNGREVYRRYCMNMELSNELMNNVLTSKEYYENAYSFYQIEDERLKGISYYSSGDYEYELSLTPEEQKELLNLYGEDVGSTGVNWSVENNFIGVLSVGMKKNYVSPQSGTYYEVSSSFPKNEDENITIINYPIFKNFSNTIMFLKEHGCEVEVTSKIKVEEISSLRILLSGEEKITYNKLEDIKGILPLLHEINYTQFQGYYGYSYSEKEIWVDQEWKSVWVEIECKDEEGKQKEPIRYLFSRIPEFIREELMK